MRIIRSKTQSHKSQAMITLMHTEQAVHGSAHSRQNVVISGNLINRLRLGCDLKTMTKIHSNTDINATPPAEDAGRSSNHCAQHKSAVVLLALGMRSFERIHRSFFEKP